MFGNGVDDKALLYHFSVFFFFTGEALLCKYFTAIVCRPIVHLARHHFFSV